MMNTPPLMKPDTRLFGIDALDGRDGARSVGVCWPAIFAGAAGAAVLSLVLLVLGTGIGFSVVSPWGHQGVSAATVGITSVIWMTVVQMLAALLGGYLAGRLRIRWVALHSHEAYFRDTAHGFLAWSVATLVTASLLSSTLGALVGDGARATAAVKAASNPETSESLNYFADMMFRPSPGQIAAPESGATSSNSMAEVVGIFSTSLKNGALSAADSQYLAQLVSQRSGLNPEDAQKRVSDTFSQAQKTLDNAKVEAQAAADSARKAAAAVSLWMVVALLAGAFTASWAATLGGRLRDGATVEPSR